DLDNDGDQDLFIGGRLKPGRYPLPVSSRILINQSNQGAVKFVDETEKVCPYLLDIGMVTDALWLDIDNDNFDDLVIAGEWMSLKILKNLGGSELKNVTSGSGLEEEIGWWNSLAKGDFDADGDVDLVAGNIGLNYKYKASDKEPFEVYAKDYDNNGIIDIILCYYEDGVLYPTKGRDKLSQHMPFLKNKFASYHEFALASIKDIFGEENLSSSINYKANNFASCIIENLGNGKFDVKPLPNMAQLSSVNSILVQDFDSDDRLDILVTGNLYQSEMETPRNDASIGLMLKGKGDCSFDPLSAFSTGLYIQGDVKNACFINIGQNGTNHILFAKNNDRMQLIKVNNLN
ncbi:MAG: VCBS repeat-containing protein, partial [Firmicutes bacterium]|nr:VCBS repeat-containing protein [Bacillota bacterium]